MNKHNKTGFQSHKDFFFLKTRKVYFEEKKTDYFLFLYYFFLFFRPQFASASRAQVHPGVNYGDVSIFLY